MIVWKSFWILSNSFFRILIFLKMLTDFQGFFARLWRKWGKYVKNRWYWPKTMRMHVLTSFFELLALVAIDFDSKILFFQHEDKFDDNFFYFSRKLFSEIRKFINFDKQPVLLQISQNEVCKCRMLFSNKRWSLATRLWTGFLCFQPFLHFYWCSCDLFSISSKICRKTKKTKFNFFFKSYVWATKKSGKYK